MADYLFLNEPSTSLTGFTDYLEQRDDRVWVIPTAQFTGFGTVVEVKGQKVRLTVAPEDLVFEER